MLLHNCDGVLGIDESLYDDVLEITDEIDDEDDTDALLNQVVGIEIEEPELT